MYHRRRSRKICSVDTYPELFYLAQKKNRDSGWLLSHSSTGVPVTFPTAVPLYISAAVAASVTAAITAAAQTSSAAAEIAQQVCDTELHTAAAVKPSRIAVHALSLLIPAASVLKTLKEHLILGVLRVKPYRLLRIAPGRSHCCPRRNWPKRCKNTRVRSSP